VNGRRFQAPIGAPTWLLSLGAASAGENHFELDGHETFLTNFITDAERFWASGVGGRASSGLWSERVEGDTADRHFEAFAVRTGAMELLLISRLPDAEYDLRHAPLQVARDAMLQAERQDNYATLTRQAAAAQASPRSLSSRPLEFDALNYDVQTGLPSRSLFIQRLTSQFEQLQRPRQTLCVLVVSIDNFDALRGKSEPDSLTLLLRQFASRLRGCLRQTDTAARLTDAEFGLLVTLGDQAQDSALRVVRELQAAMQPAFDSGTDLVTITVSVGGVLSPQTGGTARDLYDHAEAARRETASRGGNHYRFAIDSDGGDARGELALDSELRQALERSEFVLHYHPRMTMDSRVMGAEALLRWQSPLRGLVSPAQIIPFAERTGLIIAIGEWVLHKACAQWQAWQSQGWSQGLKVSVNLSVHQLEHPDVVNMVARALEESGLEPALLELEITESAAMNNIDQCIPTLHAFKRLGVSISIDDFGSGHSSFAYLKRLPVDALKIDRSFVIDLAQTQTDAAIVAAIVTVAHQLKLGTVAEGVTDTDQVGVLNELGCDEMQGFLFSKPLPAEAFEAFVRDRLGLGPTTA
jgi:diguanylate cyclase (GGDEF)-like protein